MPARIRLHQSWYRSEVLGLLRWGRTPSPIERPLGSILHPEDADAGRAFTCECARMLYLERRSQGWGVDPLRIQAYLTSSQGLTINLLGPLISDADWAARVMTEVLQRRVVQVTDFAVEFAPRDRSSYLGDMTRIDAIMTVVDEGNRRQLLAFEIKLCDRWSTRYLDPRAIRYRAPAKEIGYWHFEGDEVTQRRINQLLRSHLLASMVARQRGYSEATLLLLVSLMRDTASSSVAGEYRTSLVDSSVLKHCYLETFISAMEATAANAHQRRVSAILRTRYVDLNLSEHLLKAR